MARLFFGEKACKRRDVLGLLQRLGNGLAESEIADILGWDRRTVNNYLRALAAERKVYKEGHLWFAEAAGR